MIPDQFKKFKSSIKQLLIGIHVCLSKSFTKPLLHSQPGIGGLPGIAGFLHGMLMFSQVFSQKSGNKVHELFFLHFLAQLLIGIHVCLSKSFTKPLLHSQPGIGGLPGDLLSQNARTRGQTAGQSLTFATQELFFLHFLASHSSFKMHSLDEASLKTYPRLHVHLWKHGSMQLRPEILKLLQVSGHGLAHLLKLLFFGHLLHELIGTHAFLAKSFTKPTLHSHLGSGKTGTTIGCICGIN